MQHVSSALEGWGGNWGAMISPDELVTPRGLMCRIQHGNLASSHAHRNLPTGALPVGTVFRGVALLVLWRLPGSDPEAAFSGEPDAVTAGPDTQCHIRFTPINPARIHDHPFYKPATDAKSQFPCGDTATCKV